MASSRERNDRRPPRDGGERGSAPGFHRPGRGRRSASPDAGGAEWLWGRHAVEAALANPARTGLRRLLATPRHAEALQKRVGPGGGLRLEEMEAGEIARLLPPGAVHQGAALLADPLAPADLAEIASPAEGVLLLLDQVTDPQNVGAIFRSAAAFGARGLVLQDRHAPPLSGALAKAAAGAVDITPHARVVNLSRALDDLAELGWRAVGLAGEAESSLDEALDGGPTVLVLGSEGEGLRRLVGEHCEVLARIPMPGGFQSLNVTSAAAVALYAASLRVKSPASGERG